MVPQTSVFAVQVLWAAAVKCRWMSPVTVWESRGKEISTMGNFYQAMEVNT
jgi:hypothetical protein